MRTIERSSKFKRDYKREMKGRHRATLDADLMVTLIALASDAPLDPRCQDHGLSGDWAGYRDCHVKPDLVLIYAKPRDLTLRLARLGSHSEVFG
ncbi:type II toxin-antitoxin system YafQ family toxin [Sphingomonas sp.]|uniref:type II toxin-antitoxin system YafQ family toxin n=1 Tax=Sphingomonas sp. TaxID=28214 RepID=UPI0035BBEA65